MSNEQQLLKLLKEPGNNKCCDCGKSNPRWASFNIGCFICIRCSGLHRKMGTHISKVKSVSLDKWTNEQIENMRNNGNLKVNQNYLTRRNIPQVPEDIQELEEYIRAKYEHKRFCDSSQVNSNNVSSIQSHSYELEQLREMGFTNTKTNLKVLKECNNDLKTAIEILCNTPNSNNESNIDEIKLSHLKNMGFFDINKNKLVLKKFDNNLERSVDYLINTKNIISEKINKKAEKNDLLQEFESISVNKESNVKDDIMSLLDIDTPPKNQQKTNINNEDEFGDFVGLSNNKNKEINPPQKEENPWDDIDPFANIDKKKSSKNTNDVLDFL